MAVQNLQSPVAIARFRSRLRKATPVFSSSDASQPSIKIPTSISSNCTPEPQTEPQIVETQVEKQNIETPVPEEPQTPKPNVPVIRKFAKPQPKISDVGPNILKQAPTVTNTVSSNAVEESVVTAKNVTEKTKTLTKREREKPREKKSNRKKFKKGENPEKTKMTMFDWIYWNPDTEPMTYKEAEIAERIQDAESASNTSTTAAAADEENPDLLADEDGNEDKDKDDEGNDDESIPVPQVMIGPDGNIIIDEKSLMIPSVAATTNRLKDAPVVYEDGHTTYASFSKRKGRKTKWSHKETMKFYSALSTVGTDFSLMTDIFPKKTRHELRLKFKREEKLHKALVERAISDGQQFDMSIFESNGSESDMSNLYDSDQEPEKSENSNGKTTNTNKQTANKHTSNKHTSNKHTSNKHTNKTTQTAKPKTKRVRRKIVEDDSDFCDSDLDTSLFNSATTSSVSSEKDSAYETTISDMTNAMMTAVTGSLVADTAEAGVLDFDVNDPVGSLMEDSGADEKEDEEVDEDGNEEEEVIESLLKKTRYGRQPKRRAVFTVTASEPKKKATKTNEHNTLTPE